MTDKAKEEVVNMVLVILESEVSNHRDMKGIIDTVVKRIEKDLISRCNESKERLERAAIDLSEKEEALNLFRGTLQNPEPRLSDYREELLK